MKSLAFWKTGVFALSLVLLGTWSPLVRAGEGPVVILADGFGDCCTHRMTTLIDGLKALGAEFPAVAGRGLDGSSYGDYVVPWNSFTDRDQGFQVELDPSRYVQKAMAEGGSSRSLLGLTSNPAGLATDQGVIDKVMGAVRRGSDEKFVEEVSTYVNGLPAERPVILIGHSFGGDSVMEAAKKIHHEVTFLGALDPVGAGGLRRLERSRKISSNVRYFYNRWQNNGFFPFDYVSNGAFTGCQAREKCDQGKQRMALTAAGTATGAELGHVEFPSDAGMQNEILGIIRTLLAGKSTGAGATASGDSKGRSSESLKDTLLQQSPVKGLFGR